MLKPFHPDHLPWACLPLECHMLLGRMLCPEEEIADDPLTRQRWLCLVKQVCGKRILSTDKILRDLCSRSKKADGASSTALRMPRTPQIEWKCGFGPGCLIKADVGDGGKNFSTFVIIALRESRVMSTVSTIALEWQKHCKKGGLHHVRRCAAVSHPLK